MASRADATPVSGSAEYSIWRVILASAVGTMIEWYDFYIFGSLAAILSPKFYPPGNDTFALHCLSRDLRRRLSRPSVRRPLLRTHRRPRWPQVRLPGDPLDHGRRHGRSSACYPPIATAGWFAPITLLLIRVLQGLALGGEYGGATVYVAEHVPDGKRGFYTSFIQITATLGLFVSLLVILVTQQCHEQRQTSPTGAGAFRSSSPSSSSPSRSTFA